MDSAINIYDLAKKSDWDGINKFLECNHTTTPQKKIAVMQRGDKVAGWTCLHYLAKTGFYFLDTKDDNVRNCAILAYKNILQFGGNDLVMLQDYEGRTALHVLIIAYRDISNEWGAHHFKALLGRML